VIVRATLTVRFEKTTLAPVLLSERSPPKEAVMKVSELMTQAVESCKMNHTLDCAAQIMWTHDCGCVPIVDDDNRIVGMLTDRDICMAALSQGKRLDEIPVERIAARDVVTVSIDTTVESAESLMQGNQVRRLPVVDAAGRLVGLLSMNDIARRVERTTARPHGLSGDLVAETLAAISKPRTNGARA
jgi:CBS domain-containing protein